MINRLEQLQERLFDFDTEVRKFAQNILNGYNYRQIILDYVIENLKEGIRPDFSFIEKEPVRNQKSHGYERYTKWLREQRYDLPDFPVTLSDTEDSVANPRGNTHRTPGLWYSDFSVRIGYETIIIYNKEYALTDHLVSIWSENGTLEGLAGLTYPQIKEFTKQILPEFKRFCKRHFES